MALPAGRYGVTKNQLLKVKKLPMNTIKMIEDIQEELDTFGTAVTHDATSVVTESSDLVESGAVKDIVGWGNKNLCNYKGVNNAVVAQCKNGVTYTFSLTSTGHGGVNLKKNDVSGSVVLALIPFVEGRNSGSFTADSDFALYLNGFGMGGVTFADDVSDLQLEVGSTATPYEPYHASVEESKADNSVIGTVEGANASKAWSVGEHFISGGQFKEVTQAIASGGAISDSNTVNKPIAGFFDFVKSSATNSGFSQLTIDSNRNNVLKYGKLASIDIKFTITENVQLSGSTELLRLPFPANGVYVLMVYEGTSPYAYKTDYALYTNNGYGVFANQATLNAGTYTLGGFYFTH